MIDSLNAAQSGLQTSRTVIDNISNNLANQNTEGYIKRVANLSELSYDDNSYANGVKVTSIERQVNEYLFEQIISQSSENAYYQKASDIYGLAETIFSETDESGLSKDLDNYFQAIENLRTSPDNEIYQANLSSQAKILVENMQQLYTDVDELQESLKTELNDSVDHINELLSQIVEINDEMVQSGENFTLLDKRDTLEKELSTYVDIEVDRDSDYYKLQIAGETAIFHNTLSYDLSVVDDSTAQKDVYASTLLDDSSLNDTELITIQLNNTASISFIANTTGTSDSDVKAAIANAINSDSYMKEYVTAYLNDSDELVIESNTQGEASAFDFEILVDTNQINKSSLLSVDGVDDIHVEVLDEELSFSSGSLKAITQNISTTQESNVLQDYKDALDNLAYTLSDLTSSYIVDGDDYIYGEDQTQINANQSSIQSIDLFSGSSVLSMNFNESALNLLEQNDLEYLSSLQWKDDIQFDTTNSNNLQSFSEALQTLRVEIASNKESMDFKLESSDAISVALQATYDELTKVDSDEELINLMQYQAAYEANAKVITVVDEMLQTILAM